MQNERKVVVFQKRTNVTVVSQANDSSVSGCVKSPLSFTRKTGTIRHDSRHRATMTSSFAKANP